MTAFRIKPALAAVPGTSNHGWALAVDLCGGINVAGTAEWRWMTANAGRYGFVEDTPREPWHWVYRGGAAHRRPAAALRHVADTRLRPRPHAGRRLRRLARPGPSTPAVARGPAHAERERLRRRRSGPRADPARASCRVPRVCSASVRPCRGRGG